MTNTANPPDRPSGFTRRVTVPPKATEDVTLGTYRIDGMRPTFTVQCVPPAGEDFLTCRDIQQVDLHTRTYEQVFRLRNADSDPILATITWIGGQPPLQNI